MNEDGGFTIQYRRLWDNPVFPTKQHAAVWAWMIAAAAWKDVTIRFNGSLVTLKRGQLVIGERRVAEDFGFAKTSFRRLLSGLKAARMLDHHTDHHKTVITILNYDQYQLRSTYMPQGDAPAVDHQTDQPLDQQRTTGGPPKKEENQGKEEIPSPPDGGEVSAPKPPPAKPKVEFKTQREVYLGMREVWNELIPEGERRRRWLTEDIRPARVQAAVRAWISLGKSMAQWRAVCERIKRSSLLMGRGPPHADSGNPWPGCDFDWIIRPAYLQRLIEGRYDDGEPAPPPRKRGIDLDQLERDLVGKGEPPP